MPNWIPIRDVGLSGVIRDIQAYDLPPSAWSDGSNMRFRAGSVERRLSEFPLNSIDIDRPLFVNEIVTPDGGYRVFASDNAIYSAFGGILTDITRNSGGYNLGYLDKWTGDVFNGVLVLNNPMDVPQQWSPDLTRAEDLSNWPADWRAKAVRPFKTYLVALNMTKGSVQYPYMLNWSHPADPGTVPVSWDVTDPTKDAGLVNIGETSGPLVDCQAFGDLNVIFKTDSIWGMQEQQSAFKFRFFNISKEAGVLSQNCITTWRNGVAFISPNDCMIWDGTQVQSVLDRRMKKYFNSAMDGQVAVRAFAVQHTAYNEVWFCFPEVGAEFCTKAIVWNYVENTCSLYDLPDLAHAHLCTSTSVIVGGTNPESIDDSNDEPILDGSGAPLQDGHYMDPIITGDPNDTATWGQDDGTWDEDNTPWDSTALQGTVLQLIGASTTQGNYKLVQFDKDDDALDWTLVREGVIYVGMGQNGPVADVESVKSFSLLRIRGKGECDVYIGHADDPEADDTDPDTANYLWEGPYAFNSQGGYEIKFEPVSGRFFAVKLEGTGPFELKGVDYDISVVAEY